MKQRCLKAIIQRTEEHHRLQDRKSVTSYWFRSYSWEINGGDVEW